MNMDTAKHLVKKVEGVIPCEYGYSKAFGEEG